MLRTASALLFIIVAGCDHSTEAGAPFRTTGQMIALSGGDGGPAAACITCHGLQGEGNGAGAPRLAGLDAGYLSRQLEDYATGLRHHKDMRVVARKLSPDDRMRVSKYYASMRYEYPHATRETRGAALYDRLCAACHGRDGEGVGPANPPLAGQPASYLAAQMHYWKVGDRNNDPLGQMRDISRTLTSDQIRLLASYAAALPGPHPQAAREASRSARRADPRNDASAPRPREAE